MAKKATKPGGKSLVIVESPAKARTISKFLGRGYDVEASIGHVRDLPKGTREIPEKYKGEDWAYLGVNVNDDFTPIYIVPPDKKQQVAKLRKAIKDAKDLYLATDEDREGEAISWHLYELLKPKVPVHRLVFHEITKEAIDEALANPRDIDDGLVRAQETRRILDRLYGYEVSPLLWRKVGPRLSAGRVQSVAVRLIVERERERIDFAIGDLLGSGRHVRGGGGRVSGRPGVGRWPQDSRRAATSIPRPGKLKDQRSAVAGRRRARGNWPTRLQQASFRVTALEDKPYTTRPAAPFTTSTMQQEANRKLGFTARRTMQVAQSLYENGYITYMRTDSTNLAQVAVDAARDLVSSEYGAEYLPDRPRAYKSKVKNAQEAHEAIRPAGHPFRLPESLRSELDQDQFRLFELIWKRTIASQMADARGHRITITVEGGRSRFPGQRQDDRLSRFPAGLRRRIGRSQCRIGGQGDDPARGPAAMSRWPAGNWKRRVTRRSRRRATAKPR